MKNKVVYHNLGACSGHRNMYIRSTDIEQKNWERLLMSFPDEALFFMTKSKNIIIIDKCSKKKGKVQRIFCPVMTDFFRCLKGYNIKNKILEEHLGLAINAYNNNKNLFRKYKFFKDKINTIRVRGRTIYMKKEPTVW